MATTPTQVSETTLGYGTVTHTLVRLRADGADPDRDPDFFGAPEVSLTVSYDHVGAMSTATRTVLPEPITLAYSATGELLGADGAPGVRLVDLSDPDLTPTGSTYRAQWSDSRLPVVHFSVLAGQTTDLRDAIMAALVASGGTFPTALATPDATATIKGKLALAGDLAGTADAPTVPALAGKADTAHTHIASQVSDSTATGRSVLTAADAAAARTALGISAQSAEILGNWARFSGGWTMLGTRGQNTAVMSVGQLSVAPVRCAPVTIDQVQVNVATGATGATVRVCVLRMEPDGTFSRVHDFGAVDASTSGQRALTGSWLLPQETLWWGAVCQGADCAITTATGFVGDAVRQLNPALAAATDQPGVRIDGISGAIPASGMTASWIGTTAARLAVRTA